MTGDHHKVRKTRPRKSSHFVAEVSMKALNDPLPPYHPSTTSPPYSIKHQDPFRYYDVDLSKLYSNKSESVSHRSESPKAIFVPSVKEEPLRFQQSSVKELFPVVSNETRRLLKEVEQVKKLYQHRTVSNLASTLVPNQIQNDDRSVEQQIPNVKVVLTEVQVPEKPSPRSPRKALRTRKVARFLPDRSKTRTTLATKRHSEDVAQTGSDKIARINIKENVENVEPPKSPPLKEKVNIPEAKPTKRSSSYTDEKLEKTSHSPHRSKSEDNKDDNIKQQLREQRQSDKPWRNNMKKVSEDKCEKVNNDKEEEEKEEDSIVRKPWRNNMKKTDVKANKDNEPDQKPNRPRHHDQEKVREFMKQRRQKLAAAKKLQDAERDRLKDAIKARLVGLELWRKEQAKRTDSKPTDVAIMSSKLHEEEHLKRLLSQLTNEMRAKYVRSGSNDSWVENTNVMRREPTVVVERKVPDDSDTLSSSNHQQWQLEVQQLQQQQHNTSTVMKTAGKEEGQQLELRNQVQALFDRHEEDVALIKKSQLDLDLPTSTTSSASVLSKKTLSKTSRKPDVVPSLERPCSSSDMEEPPPQIHYADTPEPDPFNFMATVRRKFTQNDEVDKSSCMVLSEGPLSVSGSSHSSSKSKSNNISANKVVSHKSNISSEGHGNEPPERGPSSAEKNKHSNNAVHPVPTALQMRFHAELNQMESIQQAEKQLNRIKQISTLASARQQAIANQAFPKGYEREERETRAEFEARMRKELQEILSTKMECLMQNQVEATKMTAEAARQLAKIHSGPSVKDSTVVTSSGKTTASKVTQSSPRVNSTSNNQRQQVSGSSISKKSTEIPEEILTLMSRAESNIPEVLSVAENTDKSGGSIQKTLSSAIRELSVDEMSKASNITEEIAEELSEEAMQSSSRTTDNSQSATLKSDHSSTDSLSRFAGDLFQQHMEEQRVRARQQYAMIKKREKLLAEKVSEGLAKIAVQQSQLTDDNGVYQKLCDKEKRLKRHYKERKEELASLKYTLKVAERERTFLLKQRDRMSKYPASDSEDKPKSSDLLEDLASSSHSGGTLVDNDNNTSRQRSSASSPVEKTLSAGDSVKATTKMDVFKKQIGATLKAPLSPKSRGALNQQRKRHSSADSGDSLSVSQADTVSDHSDLEIKVNVLQEELNKRMVMAAKLKRQQKTKRKERLKIREDTLKQQIEVYDNLIEQTKHDLEEGKLQLPSASKIVQPQIKVPKQVVSKTEQDKDEVSQSLSSRESSTDTVLASPQKANTPVEVGTVPQWPQIEEAATDSNYEQNYSDDFTSSSASSDANIVTVSPTKLGHNIVTVSPTKIGNNVATTKSGNKERTVDAVCGHLFSKLVSDTFEAVKTASKHDNETVPKEVERDVSNVNVVVEKKISPQPQQSSPRSSSRPQDLMLTTFDISSESSDESLPPPEKQETQADNNVSSDINLDVDEEQSTEEHGFVGTFIDDDFGLSIQQESEHLRQQQLRIEEEISRIQKESIVHEVPSKPPPPYTPPSDSPVRLARPSRLPSVEVIKFVPSNRDELVALVGRMTKKLFGARAAAASVPFDNGLLSTDGGNSENNGSRNVYVRFLFDLVKDMVAETYHCETVEQNPPWMQQKPLDKERLSLPHTEAALVAHITHKVLVTFNLAKRAHKENLIVRWSQKRRDRVDQILVRELHTEEATWTDYAEDEVMVKDQLTDNIFEALISDTALSLRRILMK